MITVQDLIEYDRAHPEGAGTSPQEKMFLYQLVRGLEADQADGPLRVLEIGVSAGHLTAWLALACEHRAGGGDVWSVDNWAGQWGGAARSPESCKRRLGDLNLGHLVALHGCGSRAFFRQTRGWSCDLAWIDGDHSYEGCLADLRDGWRVTTDILAAHDWRHPLPDEAGRACRDFEREIGRRGVWHETERGIWLVSKKDRAWS